MKQIAFKNYKLTIVLFSILCVLFVVIDALYADYSAKDFVPVNVDTESEPAILERAKSAPLAAVSVIKYTTDSFHPDEEIEVPIRGDLRVEVIDERTICLVGNYARFLKTRFEEECGGFMRGIDSAAANLPVWSRNVFYNFLGAEIILKYRPTIAHAYCDFSKYEFDKALKFEKGGYWINPQGQAVFADSVTGLDKLTRNAEVSHYAYIKFAEPFEKDKLYTIKNPLGESFTFKYLADGKSSGAIKINQLGYSPAANRKYAYIGLWLGTLGALDVAKLEGREFFILKSDTNERVYGAKIARALPDKHYLSGASFTGEDTLVMDFSDFNKIGKYKIFVEGVGYSWEFEISNNAIGEAFYIHSKGLYHKRCGIAKAKPYTNWTMGACHKTIYKSSFPPNNMHYNADSKRKDYGFFNADGKSIGVSHFNLISQLPEGEAVQVSGGWHDAADYDRRPYHYDVVNDLLSVYLLKPENFSDNQLNIPESGNGIADILDEACWGMSVWKNLQNKNGSVGGWIEATSHPKNYNPSTDEQPYFLSAATRESTMQYAAHASMLALALKNDKASELSNEYLASAIRAYDWAKNPANRFVKMYNYVPAKSKESTVISYKEAPDVPCEFEFKAAYNLWLLTRENKYLDRAVALQHPVEQKIAETTWRVNPFLFTEFLKYSQTDASLNKLRSYFKTRMLKYADERLNWLNNNYPYKIAWYDAGHPYVSHMSWGNYHPLRNAKFFVNAYELTNDAKYRDAAYLANDFHNGANPSGQTMTSGLGKNYPIKFLDLASYADGIVEYVQGITPYRDTFGIPREDVLLAHALIYSPRPDKKFNPQPTMLLPDTIYSADAQNVGDFTKSLGKAWPIWRRFANVEAFTVAASEFTVSETIAPAAAVTGWLLQKGWKPSDELKYRKPASDLRKLEGFAPLP